MVPAVGSGLATMAATGQLARLTRHLQGYAEGFQTTYFSWLPLQTEWPHYGGMAPHTALMCPRRPVSGPLGAFLRPLREWRSWHDLDLVRSMNLLGSIPAITARIAYRVPFVVSFGADYQAIATLHGRSQRHLAKWRWLERAACATAAAVMVSNRTYAERLRLAHSKARIVFHPNWVNLDQFTPLPPVTSPARMSLPLMVLFVGRLVEVKNLIRLAQAADGLTVGGRPVHLYCVGAGPLADRLRGQGVEVVGPIPWGDLPGVYRMADAFALPSLSEGHPKALTEAMASGLPCVVSAQTCHDLGWPDGLVACDPERVSSIREAITRALTYPIILGSATRDHAEAHWDLTALMPRELRILEDAAQNS